MTRTVDDLEQNAEKFWPLHLTDIENRSSIIPRLIETQEKFIGVLYVADGSPTAWKDVLKATTKMPGNLFLKHLIVLTDIGGEKLQRFRTYLKSFFPKETMTYSWRNREYSYQFRSLQAHGSWKNPQLGMDGPGLAVAQDLQDVHEDVAMLLIHGGSAIGPDVPEEISNKCTVGCMLGHKRELDAFVRQRYIFVSRITGGATANMMGQLCEAYVRDRLRSCLQSWDFSGKTIPGISHTAGRTDMSFDIVARSPSGGTCCAIEVSFQVTTNSVIERKAGQADARQRLLHDRGHRVAYVIDGAGNLERRSALSTICGHSDCTVTLRDEELDNLAEFLKSLESEGA